MGCTVIVLKGSYTHDPAEPDVRVCIRVAAELDSATASQRIKTAGYKNLSTDGILVEVRLGHMSLPDVESARQTFKRIAAG